MTRTETPLDGCTVRLVANCWQGGEWTGGRWDALTGRHGKSKAGKARAMKDLKYKFERLGFPDEPIR